MVHSQKKSFKRIATKITSECLRFLFSALFLLRFLGGQVHCQSIIFAAGLFTASRERKLYFKVKVIVGNFRLDSELRNKKIFYWALQARETEFRVTEERWKVKTKEIKRQVKRRPGGGQKRFHCRWNVINDSVSDYGCFKRRQQRLHKSHVEISDYVFNSALCQCHGQHQVRRFSRNTKFAQRDKTQRK